MPSFTIDNHRHHRAPPQFSSTSQRKLLIFFLKCVIMVVVISIFLFLLGFAAIVLLHFLFMSHTFHRRCTRFMFPITNPASQSAVSSAATSFTLPHIHALLPNVEYSVTAFPRTIDCAICLDSFQEGDDCRNLPVCKHLFHAKCVDRWIGKKPNCPVCRTRVDFDSGLPGSSLSGDNRWKKLWSVGFEEGTAHY